MKKVLIVIGGLVITGLLIGLYMYNKPHKNISRAQPDFELTSQELFVAFESDEQSANQKYLDKTIQVNGKVISTNTDEEGLTSVTLEGGGTMFGVICKLDPLSHHERTTFETGERVTLKGICSGVLMDVVLVRCVEVG